MYIILLWAMEVAGVVVMMMHIHAWEHMGPRRGLLVQWVCACVFNKHGRPGRLLSPGILLCLVCVACCSGVLPVAGLFRCLVCVCRVCGLGLSSRLCRRGAAVCLGG